MSDIEVNENMKHFSSQDNQNYINHNLQMKMLCLKETEVKNFMTRFSNFYPSGIT